MVKTLILRAPGTNCDLETGFAFQEAGASVEYVHINRLTGGNKRLGDYGIMVVPGGFTYGDDIAAGTVLANELRLKLGDDIRRFIDDGKLILGICNGFQVLVKAVILPEPSPDGAHRFTLASNDSNQFECRWVHLKASRESNCVFTEGIDRLYLPVAHAEGKVVADPDTLPDINAALRYTDEGGNTGAGYPHNPNGSVDDIAGVCDKSGRVFTLMPHPERYIRGTQHPRWTSQGAKERGDGFKIFQNAVSWAERL